MSNNIIDGETGEMGTTHLKMIAESTLDTINNGNYKKCGKTVILTTSGSQRDSAPWMARVTTYERAPCIEPREGPPSNVTVGAHSTLAGIAWMQPSWSDPVAVLNFASGKNPGGGFLRGAEAQEESIARSSTLYRSIKDSPHYQENRKCGTCAYLDTMLYSEDLVFKNDDGHYLDKPLPVGIITAAAPNRGAMLERREDTSGLPELLKHRVEKILGIAVNHGQKRIILGAWGCGVFHNNTMEVIDAFKCGLDKYGGHFDHVHFAILDVENGPMHSCFRLALTETT